jgi:hypothetical protein
MLKYAAIVLIGILAWQFAGRAFLNQTYQSVTKKAQTKSDLHFDRPPELRFERLPGLGNPDKPPSNLAR